MTLPQFLAFAIVGVMMALFVWGRLRYDLVAMLALLAAIVTGIVSPKEAFSGFSDDIVIIVASALLVSAGIARSGAVEGAMRFIAPYMRSAQAQVVVLTIIVTVLSGFVKNIGALAMMLPVAFQIARRSNTSPSSLLMPMAFGSLLGGVVTLVGTSPNIIVSRVREEMTGTPFAMFDFAPAGLGIALAGLVFLSVGYRLLPARKGSTSIHAAIDIEDYTTEARITEKATVIGKTLADLRALGDGDVNVTAVVRDDKRSSHPLPDMALRENDVLVLQGDPDALERVVARANLALARQDRPPETDEPGEEVAVIEAIVGVGSLLVGRTVETVRMYQRYGLNLLAVSRRGERITERLRDYRLSAGDLLVLQGLRKDLPDTLKDLDCLPLAERAIALGGARRGWIAVSILLVAVALVATGAAPVSIAFFGAAVLMIATGALPIREAYASMEWPILVMLGCLIPVSEAIRATGGTDLIAGWLSMAAGNLPGAWSLVLIMVAAMAVTPFLNNAATVLVMAPIAAAYATQLGYRQDAFLMAVAIGAACDFLTPIGHQCNTLVMGPGGYRFTDYARLGAPLSLLVVAVGAPLIMLFWPLE
ncbi:MAG: SLC13 family permease [Beijerinckiaceae bacterium]